MTVTNLANPSQRFSPGRALLRFAAATGLALVPVASCTCEVVEITEVGPAILVDVCAEPQEKDGVGNVIGGFEECALDFGEADISVKTSRKFKISNPTANALNISKFELQGTEQAFKLVEPLPDVVGAGLSVEVTVEVRPQFVAEIATEVVITSNAVNTTVKKPSAVRIPITLKGVDNGTPSIEVVPDPSCGTADPLGVNFNQVATGGVSICEVTVTNLGTRDLYFDSLDFVEVEPGVLHIEPADSQPGPNIAVTGTPPTGDVPLPGCPTNGPEDCTNNSFKLRLAFAPDALGAFSSSLRFATNDPQTPVIDMPIIGRGVVGPTCVASIKEVNGVTTPPFNIEPLDDVTFTSEGSAGATPDVTIVSTRWEVKERGPGSTVVLSDPNGTDTGLLFANRRGVDVAGRFEICAVVTDSLGTESNNTCCVDFEAIPSQAMLVQATWANSDGDMDLHVTKRNSAGEYCVTSLGGGGGDVDAPFAEDCNDTDTELDCNYASCRSTNNDSPEWDGAAGRTAGDPTLDIDDLTGFGPENINIDLPIPGSYGFGVTTFSSFGGPYLVTIRLFVFGRLAGEWTQELSEQFLEAGAVHFTAEDPSRPCVEDLSDGDPADECPGL
jgi:hypothetical protein